MATQHDEDEGEDEAAKSKSKTLGKDAKTKPLRVKDVLTQQLLEGVSDEEEDNDDDDAPRPLTHNEEQASLKKAFLQVNCVMGCSSACVPCLSQNNFNKTFPE